MQRWKIGFGEQWSAGHVYEGFVFLDSKFIFAEPACMLTDNYKLLK